MSTFAAIWGGGRLARVCLMWYYYFIFWTGRARQHERSVGERAVFEQWFSTMRGIDTIGEILEGMYAKGGGLDL